MRSHMRNLHHFNELPIERLEAVILKSQLLLYVGAVVEDAFQVDPPTKKKYTH